MNVYQDLEDCLYNVVDGLFPLWRTIFAYGNGPEPQTPYCAIDVTKIEPVGLEYTSTTTHIDPNFPDRAATVTAQDNLVRVTFVLTGVGDQNTEVSEMANALQTGFRTPKGYELLARNRLALHGKMNVVSNPQRRETQVYMQWELDCTFAYTAVSSDYVDWIEVLGITGIYHDAGREPDHIIKNKLDLTQP